MPDEACQIVSRRGTAWLECPALARLPWLLHAFSTRAGGVSPSPAAGLNLGYIAADPAANVRNNRRRFLAALGAQNFALAELRQIHSSIGYQVVRGRADEIEFLLSGEPASRPSGEGAPRGDALFTDQPGLLLAIKTADCLPVLLADTRRHAVGAVHAGWRGALDGVVEKAAGEMRRLFGSRPRELVAALGPSIRVCCYEVGPEVEEAYCGRFREGDQFFREVPKPSGGGNRDFLPRLAPGRKQPTLARHFDLLAAAQAQLLRAGLRPAQIRVAEFCTACRTDLFYSHRREGGRTGRMMAVVGIRLQQQVS